MPSRRSSAANTFALAYNAKSVTDTAANSACAPTNRSRCTDGIFTLRGRAAWAHDFNRDRAIGATFQTLPGASLRRQRRAQARRRRAGHRLGRNEMAQRLVGRRQRSKASSRTSRAATPARAWCAMRGDGRGLSSSRHMQRAPRRMEPLLPHHHTAGRKTQAESNARCRDIHLPLRCEANCGTAVPSP